MRRHRVWATGLVLLAIALVAAGCGSSGNSSSSGESSGGSSSSGGSGSSGEFKVAMLLPGSVDDQGYNADGKRSAEQIEKETGSEVALTESVAVANQTDVYRQFASQGYNLVIGWGGQFTEGAVAASEEFPETHFLVVNSNVKNGTNLSSMDTAIEQWQFFAGFVAAKLSKTGSVGWIGGQCFPATAANLSGTEAGAKYANPNVDFKSKFTGDFEDPTKAQSAATAMIDEGVGSITGNLNNGWPGVYKAAENAQIPLVTEWVDNHQQAPSVIASSVLKSQARFVAEEAKQAQEGKLKGTYRLYPLPKNWGPVISNTKLMPKGLYEETLALQKKVADGQIKVPRNESCPK